MGLMSIQQLFPDEGILFGSDIDPEVNTYLQQAVHAHAISNLPQAEKLLWQAQHLKPEQLEVYIALYKFYFYKNRLSEAEQVALLGLNMAAHVGGFSADWMQLTRDSASWDRAQGAERIYLYTLKALGFIRLRRLEFAAGQQVLEKLSELDPFDQVGGSVIREIATAMQEVECDE
jgi:tetratricopeptide (TPR) repeat protein